MVEGNFKMIRTVRTKFHRSMGIRRSPASEVDYDLLTGGIGERIQAEESRLAVRRDPEGQSQRAERRGYAVESESLSRLDPFLR